MDLVVAAICLVGFILGLYGMPEIWRNEVGYDTDRPPTWWLLGIAFWRGMTRLPPVALSSFFIGIPFLVAEQFGIEWLRFAAGVPLLAIMVLICSVFFFNRPKQVVVPHLRHQPGAIREWLGADVEPTPPPARPGPIWRPFHR